MVSAAKQGMMTRSQYDIVGNSLGRREPGMCRFVSVVWSAVDDDTMRADELTRTRSTMAPRQTHTLPT